jgi:hypothetical protein
LLWLGIPSLYWIGVGRVCILVSFLSLGEIVSVFPTKYEVGYKLIIYSLFNIEVHSFYY